VAFSRHRDAETSASLIRHPLRRLATTYRQRDGEDQPAEAELAAGQDGARRDAELAAALDDGRADDAAVGADRDTLGGRPARPQEPPVGVLGLHGGCLGHGQAVGLGREEEVLSAFE
jgi:hypothetical protein